MGASRFKLEAFSGCEGGLDEAQGALVHLLDLIIKGMACHEESCLVYGLVLAVAWTQLRLYKVLALS